jgi:hypothetical protein
MPAEGVSEALVFDLARCKKFPESKKSYVSPELDVTTYQYCNLMRNSETCLNYEAKNEL